MKHPDFARYMALWENLLSHNGDDIQDKEFLNSFDIIAYETSKMDFIKCHVSYDYLEKVIIMKLFLKRTITPIVITLCSTIEQLSDISFTIHLNKDFKRNYSYKLENINKSFIEKFIDNLNNLYITMSF